MDNLPDIIPADQFKPDEASVPNSVHMDSVSPDIVPADQFQSDEDKYGTTGQQLTTAAEHAASSATFGLSTKAETALGVKPEDIRARTEQNPVSAGVGEIGGLLIPGAPEARALESAGKLASNVVRGSTMLSKVGRAAVKGAVENALFQGGDEVSKAFTEDPGQTAQTAMSSIGLSTILGGALGAGFGSIPELWNGSKADKFVDEFKSRINEHLTNPDLESESANNLTSFHGETQKGSDSLFKGAYDDAGNRLPSVKDQAVEKALPAMNDKILDQGVGEVTNKFMDSIEKMKEDADTFQPKFTKSLEKDFQKWQTTVDRLDVKPIDIFKATEDLKRTLQERSKIGIPIDNSNPAFDSIKELKSLAADLRKRLEDESVWGEAGKFQKETNSAYSEFQKPLKDFNQSFGAKVGGEYQVDPDKVSSYLNQAAKEKGAIRNEKLQNYLDAADKYRDSINEAHEKIGIAGPFDAKSKDSLNMLTDKLPIGAKAADSVIKGVLSKSGGNSAGAIGGVLAGWPGYMVGKHIVGPVLDSVVPNIIKPILGSAKDGTALKTAMDYIGEFSRGESRINRGISNLFKAGKEVLPASLMPDEKDKTKLDNQLKQLAQNPEKMTDVSGQLSHYLPDHGQAIAQTSMVAVNYLNSQRPESPKVSPMDTPNKIDPMKKAEWNRTLGIAQQPLSILNSIKQGTLQPNDIKTLSTLYPSLYKKISSGIVSEISSRIDKSELIPYRTKMGMSLFLGQPVDSTMQPQSILAAQPFTQQPAQQSQPQSKKATTAQASKSMAKATQSAMTPEQNRVAQRSGAEKA